MRKLVLMIILLYVSLATSFAQIIQAESMTVGGPFAGKITSPFSGAAFYGNGDKADGSIGLTNVTGLYNVTIAGASSNTSSAQIDLLIDGSKVGTFSFNSTAASNSIKPITISTGTSAKAIQLLLSTDNGSNDTYVDNISFAYQGPVPPPRPAPTLPTTSAFESGQYRNMFVEAGKSATDVSNKMTQMWNQFFVNGDANSQKLFYPVGTDMAYILDTGNDDIRSEGMSYGMMICVQLDKQTEFNKLWKFAKTYSQHPAGATRAGLFSWQLSKTDFSKKDDNSAPDGEEYYVTSLFFAHARWGSAGTFNYKAEADYILDNMLNKPAAGSGGCPTNLIDVVKKQVVFGICGNSSTFTDPSYHLPAFYEIWARYASRNNQLWTDMAVQSRTYLLPKAAHPTTGLMPDYSTFDGVAVNDGDHGKFEYDAWRNIMNMGFDQAWFKQSSSTITPLINRQIDFFKNKPGYASLWTLDGTFSRTNDHSPGLVACNAVGSLALADAKVWPFIDELFDTPIPSGQYRYYDGLLYMMSYMHLSGNFKIYTPGGVVTSLSVSPSTLSVDPAAGNSSITVTSNTSWTVTDDQTWITTSVASGANNGAFTISVTANTASTSRSGVVTITGGGLSRTVSINQSGVTANTLTVSPTTLSVASAASNSSITVTSNTSWAITDDQTWITTSVASGANNGTFTINTTVNAASTSRSGVVTIAGGGITRTVNVTQSGASVGSRTIVVSAKGTSGTETIELRINNAVINTWTLSTAYQNFSATTGTGAIRVQFTNDAANRDVQVDFIQINGTTLQAENQAINTAYFANGSCGGGSNSEFMHCNGYIEFAEPTNSLAVTPTTLSIGAAASANTITVTSNSTWTISSNQTWLTTSVASGTNNGSFIINAAANTSTSSRSGVITLSGGGLTSTVNVTQSGVVATLTVNPTTLSFGTAASSSAISVTSNTSWSISSNQTWLTSSIASGANNGSFTINAAANTAASRSGVITVTGGGLSRTINVTQSGVSTSRSVVVRAKGLSGTETLELRVNNIVITTWTLSTVYQDLSSSIGAGTVRVQFTNDAGNRDAQIDYIIVNGTTFQAENQAINTAYFANGSCGGGSNSELMHCNGYIEFAGSSNARSETSNADLSLLDDLDSDFGFYPNPNSTKKLTVELPAGTTRLNMMDCSGRQMTTMPINGERKIDVEVDVTPGVYIIHTESPLKARFKKLIIQ
jgi:endo-1,4-beta-D-glucanase Y